MTSIKQNIDDSNDFVDKSIDQDYAGSTGQSHKGTGHFLPYFVNSIELQIGHIGLDN